MLLAFVLAVVMFVFPLTISFPLLDPDEGLHASIAREMVERGQWITPTLLGRPFLDKPILYFWVQAASMWLLGPSEVAVRLPGLMFGLLGAFTTGLLAWRLFDRRTGLIAGILYATTILPTALAQAASHDVALIPWINLTLLMFWEADHAATHLPSPFGRGVGGEGREGDNRLFPASRPHPNPLPKGEGTICRISLYSLGAGLFLGLAILTKGLTGVAVVGLAYGSYLLITRRFSLAILLRGAAVLLVAGLVASPWYLAIEHHHPGYLRYFFIERHLLGFATDWQPHGDQPWWYYLPVLLGGGLPWIGYLPIVAHEGLARCDRQNRMFSGATPLLWSWLIGWTLLMQLAGSKLATYLWPVFPPMAILAATAWKDVIDGSLIATARQSFARTFTFSSWTGPIVLPAAVLVVQVVYDVRFAWPVWVAVGIMAMLTPAPLIPWRAGRPQLSLVVAALSLAGQFIVVMALVLPAVAETCSARQLARHFNRLGRMPARLVVVEGRIGSLPFYLDPPIRDTLTPDRLQQRTADALPRWRPGDVIAVPWWKLPKLRGHFDVDHTRYDAIGSYRLYDVPSVPAEADGD